MASLTPVDEAPGPLPALQAPAATNSPRRNRSSSLSYTPQNSVRVRRTTPAPSADPTPASTAPSTGARLTPSPSPPSPVGTRPRSRTITAALQDDFESGGVTSLPRPGVTGTGFGEGYGLDRRLRAATISSGVGDVRTRRRSSVGSRDREPIAQPSVVIDTSGASTSVGGGRARSSSRASSHRSHPTVYPPAVTTVDEDADEAAHHTQLETDVLDVLDAEVSTAGALSNIAGGIAVPNLNLPFFNKPVIHLDDTTPSDSTTTLVDETAGPAPKAEDEPTEEETFEAHVARLVRKREAGIQWRKHARGLWAFMKTPIGVFFTICALRCRWRC